MDQARSRLEDQIRLSRAFTGCRSLPGGDPAASEAMYPGYGTYYQAGYEEEDGYAAEDGNYSAAGW